MKIYKTEYNHIYYYTDKEYTKLEMLLNMFEFVNLSIYTLDNYQQTLTFYII